MGSVNLKYFKHHFNSCGESQNEAPWDRHSCLSSSFKNRHNRSVRPIELVALSLEGNTYSSCLKRFHLQLET
jgi:hypothetical protein